MTDEQEAKFLDNLKLVDAEIGRLASKLRIEQRGAVGLDDLLTMGRLGLMDAVKRWRPGGGSTFESFARMRIKGMALDEVRRMDFMPRSRREKINAAIAAGEDVEIGGLISIERSGDEDSDGLSEILPWDGLDAGEESESRELGRLAFEWIDEFPDAYQRMIRGIYLNGKLMREVAEELEVTESRVCQMHIEVIEWYRARMRWMGVEL